jgi:hypothetical protein
MLTVALVVLAVSLPAGSPPEVRPQDASSASVAPPTCVFAGRAARRAQFRNDKVDAAIRLGVAWLRNHQDPDGRWDADDFMKHDPAKDACDGPGNAVHDVGVTGLALLAMLAQADRSLDEGSVLAADWLVRQLDGDGRVSNASFDFLYGQAIAALALVEASALLGLERHRRGAEAALRYLAGHRHPDLGWRYQPRATEADSSLSSWCLIAFAAAAHAGIEVPFQDVGAALAWFDTVGDATGRCGYSAAGQPSSRKPGDHVTRFPPEKGHATTAAALHARLWCGMPPTAALAMAAAALLGEQPPSTDPAAQDLYYWFHGSSCMAMSGGGAAAKKWEAAAHKTLLATQRREKSATGSWDPVDVWGEDGGRVATTAFGVLALSSPYRLARADAAAIVPDQPAWRRLQSSLRGEQLGDAFAEVDKLVPVAAAADATIARCVRWLLAVQFAHGERQLANLEKVWPSLLDRKNGLEALRDRCGLHAVGDRAAKELAALRANPALQREEAAEKEMRAIQKAYDAWRAQPASSKLRQVRDDLERFLGKHRDTSLGVRAERLLAALPPR